MRTMTNIPGLALVLLLALGLATAAAQVQTSLNSNVGQVGVPLQLQYQFSNIDAPRDMPRSLMVDGLDIHLSGTSRRVEMVNFQTTSSLVYIYTVVPNRPGNFTIPGFVVQCGGKQVRTEPAELRISGGGAYAPQAPNMPQSPSRGTAPTPSGGDGTPYYGEIVMGAKSAYVGEVVPVELRFYFRSDMAFDSLQPPSFGGDGFTAARLSEPDQSQQTIGDVPYNVVTFRSAITPVKSGQIEIPRAAMQGRMMVQGGATGLDPFFDQFFRNMPGMGARAENIEVRTNLRKLEVLPLPKEGRPESFGGAIGQFSMSAKASPKSAGPGEPVILSLSIEGRGNFDAMAAPVLAREEGWRTYAPKESFTAADDSNFGNSSGTKTFAYSLVAKEQRDATPAAAFSYFDPREKKYVTLSSEPIPVAAAAATSSPDRTSNVAAAGPPTKNEEHEAPAAGREGIASPADKLSPHAPGFVALLQRPWFLWVNAVLLVIVFLSVPVLFWWKQRARKKAETAKLEADLLAAKSALLAATTRVSFFAAAARLVEARLALSERAPARDLAATLDRRVSDPVLRRDLQSLLSSGDELRYGGEGDSALADPERRRITEILQKLENV